LFLDRKRGRLTCSSKHCDDSHHPYAFFILQLFVTDEMYVDEDTEKQIKYVGLLSKENEILGDESILSCIS
jgi:hypothetical protein